MSKPRRTDQTDKEQFVLELKLRRVACGMDQKDIGGLLNLSPARISGLMADPDSMTVGRLRKVIRTVLPDPIIVLAYLGYDQKTLNRLKEGKADG
jgi:hypothetical protein